MDSKNIGWASFYNEGFDSFTKEFQLEMSKQLASKFDLMVGIDNYLAKNEFQLHIGMTPLKTMYQNGFAFCLVEIINRYSFSTTLTAYWKSNSIKNEDAIHSIEVNEKNIEFGWCKDFDTEKFLNFDDDKIVSDIQNKTLGFKCSANFTLYPDISYTFIFNEIPAKTELKKVELLMKENFKNSYVSEISGTNNEYIVTIDFQNTNFKDGGIEIDQFMRNYLLLEIKKTTKSITIN